MDWVAADLSALCGWPDLGKTVRRGILSPLHRSGFPHLPLLVSNRRFALFLLFILTKEKNSLSSPALFFLFTVRSCVHLSKPITLSLWSSYTHTCMEQRIHVVHHATAPLLSDHPCAGCRHGHRHGPSLSSCHLHHVALFPSSTFSRHGRCSVRYVVMRNV